MTDHRGVHGVSDDFANGRSVTARHRDRRVHGRGGRGIGLRGMGGGDQGIPCDLAQRVKDPRKKTVMEDDGT